MKGTYEAKEERDGRGERRTEGREEERGFF